MKRFFDIILALMLIFLLWWIFLIIWIWVSFISRGSALYWSDRVGKNNIIFQMPKFRTMKIDTPQIATHLMTEPENYLIPSGKFLRSTSLDELPQLWTILTGKMSFVGPRPALFNQYDLVSLRVEKGVDKLVPGITGWAQIHGRDDLSIIEKVEFDNEYLQKYSLWLDIKILWTTFLKVSRRDGINH